MTGPKSKRPTRADLAAAREKTIPNIIAPGLKILFCGINPGLYSAAIGHHFGRPGNRFWPTLYAAGFTPRLFDPAEEQELLPLGYGITNVVDRATATADELTSEEIVEGGKHLLERVRRYAPRYLAVLGMGVYRTAFKRPKATFGLQSDLIGDTKIWLLPCPSGLNAFYNDKLTDIYTELRIEN